MRHLLLAVLLAVLWLAISGHFEGLILAMGAVSVALVVWLSRRMRVVDEEGMPLDSIHRALPYSFWLLGQIVQSNLAMLPVIFGGRSRIRPRLLRIPAGEQGALGQVIYANSITMTPGTVTLEVSDDELTVHALTEESAAGLATGEMQGRALRVARPPSTK